MKFNSTLFQLSRAKSEGYTQEFAVLGNGLIQCVSSPNRTYDLEEVLITFIDCAIEKITLYLIVTKDGLKGTAIQFWDDE